MKFPMTSSITILALSLAGCGGTAKTQSGSASGSASSSASGGATTGSDRSANSDTPSGGAPSATCGEAATPHPSVARQLPAGFLTVAGWTATEAVTQGKTQAIRGVVVGNAENIVAVRDAAVAAIASAGYTKTGSDQEPGAEADADFSGPYQGNINVRALCRGYLVVTYTIEK
jgi:hypothetical protein